MQENLLKLWKKPTAAFRGKPFWSWNGKLEERELIRQLQVFKEMGMGGAFMHSRTGLATEYLGEEWFHLTNRCADEAEKLGLEAWLYDEDRWPSGSAGGKATKEMRYRMKYLRLTIVEAGATIPWPEKEFFVAAFSAEVEGLRLGHYSPIDYKGRADSTRPVLLFAWEYMAPHSFYNGSAYLDTLDPEATEHFLQLTHDKYFDKCGERVGKSIRGIFTDEPHHGFVFCDTHGQPGPVETRWITPWTHALPDRFKELFGYELVDKLPELFLQKDGVPYARIKWQYMEVLQQMFLDNWAKPMQERCRRLGLVLTGHVLHEDSLGAQAVPCGSVMRYYEFIDWPGVDILGNRNQNYWVVQQLASVARQMGRPWLMSELYGCTGWDMAFDGHKRIGDWQALLGINLRCHHLSWYSMAGESKRDYPASISFQSNWYREYEVVETYFSRLHVLLQAGRPLCDVLVVNPVESLWARIYPGWATWLQSQGPDFEVLEETYRKVFTWLSEAHIDFDYGDEDHLARFGCVDSDSTELLLGQMRYRVVVVAGMETIRSSTLDLLNKFQSVGGTVVFADEPPFLVEVEPSEKAAGLAKQSVMVPLEREQLTSAVRAASPAAGRVRIESASPGLISKVRDDGDIATVVVMNPSDEREYAAVKFSVDGSVDVAEWDCLTGQRWRVATDQKENETLWTADFGLLKERVFLIGAGVAEGLLERPSLPDNWRSILTGSLSYSLDEPNLAVLDHASFSVDGGEWEGPLEVLRVEKALCECTGVPLRAGDMVQPWAAAVGRDSLPSQGEGIPVRLRFGFTAEAGLGHTPVSLLMEQVDKFSIFLNGERVTVPAATDWLIDPCLRKVPLPSQFLFTNGSENIIELRCLYRQGIDLEAIFLCGQFGVSLRDRRCVLHALPAKLAPGDIAEQGLPFYSGRLNLRVPVAGAQLIKVDPVGAAAVVLRAPDGSQSRVLPWQPFVSELEGLVSPEGETQLEILLTRHNTFGPLHSVPINPGFVAPTSFRTDGRSWTDDYQLIPAGFMGISLQ